MSRSQPMASNPFWRGGRSVSSGGYVLIKVGTGHHLADVRGYAYEHRLVAEQKIGRRLRHGEVVHHIDENKLNNAPENLAVAASQSDHRMQHHRASPRALLTFAQAEAIRTRRAAGEPVAAIARDYGVSRSVASLVVNGRTYLTPPPLALYEKMERPK